MTFGFAPDHACFADAKMQKNNLFESAQMVTDVYCLEPGQEQRVHSHVGEAKMYYVIEGQGEFTVGDRTQSMGPGHFACAAAGIPHGVANRSVGRLTVLVVIAPNPNLRKT
jgi:quercetin dioxygenase-like cupin family protein